MTHGSHMWWMVGLTVVGGLLWASGAVGAGALVLLWPLACIAMMAAMMWTMRPGAGQHDGSSHDEQPAGREPAGRSR